MFMIPCYHRLPVFFTHPTYISVSQQVIRETLLVRGLVYTGPEILVTLPN